MKEGNLGKWGSHNIKKIKKKRNENSNRMRKCKRGFKKVVREELKHHIQRLISPSQTPECSDPSVQKEQI